MKNNTAQPSNTCVNHIRSFLFQAENSNASANKVFDLLDSGDLPIRHYPAVCELIFSTIERCLKAILIFEQNAILTEEQEAASLEKLFFCVSSESKQKIHQFYNQLTESQTMNLSACQFREKIAKEFNSQLSADFNKNLSELSNLFTERKYITASSTVLYARRIMDAVYTRALQLNSAGCLL